jgi:hypothetical protein
MGRGAPDELLYGQGLIRSQNRLASGRGAREGRTIILPSETALREPTAAQAAEGILVQVESSAGGWFNVRVVHPGDRYGLNDCLIFEDTDGRGPMLEFYDADKPSFGPRGLFVSRYDTATLFKWEDPDVGLCLDGANEEIWSIGGEALDQLSGYLLSGYLKRHLAENRP